MHVKFYGKFTLI